MNQLVLRNQTVEILITGHLLQNRITTMTAFGKEIQ